MVYMLRFLFCVFLVLFQIGCSDKSIPDFAPEKPTLRHEEMTFNIPVDWADSLPSYFIRVLTPYIKKAGKTKSASTSVHLTISGALDVEQIKALREFWLDQGLRVQSVHIDNALSQNKMRVDVYQVILPVCGKWPDEIGQGASGGSYKNFGCATAYNHLLSLQDPKVLFEPDPIPDRDAYLFITPIDKLETELKSSGGSSGGSSSSSSGSLSTSGSSSSSVGGSILSSVIK